MTPATVEHFDGPPQVDSADERSWIVRAANFAVRLSGVETNSSLKRANNPDEYFVLPIGCGVQVEAGGQTLEVESDTLVIVPPGSSIVRPDGQGIVVSIFSSLAQDLLELAGNGSAYAAEPFAAPLETWPEPVGGYRLRPYRLEDFNRPDTLFRLFRTRNLMVNVFRPREEPRDVHKLSPHSHQNFEQGSLSLRGDWIHYLRYPWTMDLTQWRPDEAIAVGSPSLTVIPPTVLHTSRNVSDGPCRLVDIFAGPRVDFSRRAGLVCNADEYPVPPEIAALPPLETAD